MTILCPECRRPVEDEEALLCLYCGASLKQRIGLFGHIRYTKPALVGAASVFILILALLFLIFRR